MRDNSNDRTLERMYIEKWQLLIKESERVKEKKHPHFRLVQDFDHFHGTSWQTTARKWHRAPVSQDTPLSGCCMNCVSSIAIPARICRRLTGRWKYCGGR